MTCHIPVGRITALIGPNGAGKTTLLLAIMGLIPYSGTIRYPAYPAAPPRIGYVPQRLDLDRGLPCTVEDLFALSISQRPLWAGKNETVRRGIRESLDRVGAKGLENRFLGKLSGGELQRVLLAMALEGNPEILLLDEPTAGVDAPGEEMFCDVLSDIQQQRRLTVVLISHDLSVVANHAEQVICLNKTVRCSGGVSALTEENLLKTYGLHIQIYPHTHGPHCALPPEPQTDLFQESTGRETRKPGLGKEKENRWDFRIIFSLFQVDKGGPWEDLLESLLKAARFPLPSSLFPSFLLNMETLFNPLYASLQSWVPFEWAQFSFMWRAVLAMGVIAPLCAVMGVHVVNFRMAFFSDAISHSTFTGVALGILLGLDPFYSLIGLGVLAGLFITQLKRRSELSSDTIISVILSGLVAIGITLLFVRQETRNFDAYLYGAILALTDGELVFLFLVGGLIFILMAGWFNRLILISLNMNLASSRGIAAGRMEYLFAVLLALVVTFSLRAVGLFMVTALLVIPAATARTLARGIGSLFWIAVGAASFSGLSGILLSFYLDTPAGATIILISCLLFLLSWIRQRVLG